MPLTATNTYDPSRRLVPQYDADDALRQAVNLPASVSYVKGTVLGEVTATPGTFAAYASGNSDGTQVPKAILEYDCATDSAGNITEGSTTAGVAPFGVTSLSTPAYFSGFFACAELTGLDANALSAANWNLISGTVSTGVVRIG